MKLLKIVSLIFAVTAPWLSAITMAQVESIDSSGLKTQLWLEDFNDNRNNWDVYSSRKTESKIEGGVYEIRSNIERGTVRYIPRPLTGRDFEIETQIKVMDGQRSCKIGLIFSFKDFNNYNFFMIRYNKYFVGQVLNGEIKYKVNGLALREELVTTLNTLKIKTEFDKCEYYLNGTLLNTLQTPPVMGVNIGFMLDGVADVKVNWLRVLDKDIAKNETEKVIYAKPVLNGICVDQRGYVITCLTPDIMSNHIAVEMTIAGSVKHFKSSLIAKDSIIGLALIKISDSTFTGSPAPAFKIQTSGTVRENQSLYSLQLPLKNSAKKKEAYAVKGTLLSKKGFAANTGFYQLSQNREDLINGSAIFTEDGECLGLYQKQKSDFDGVSYAAKSFYFRNLFDNLPDEIIFDNQNTGRSGSPTSLYGNLSTSIVLIKIY